MTYTTVEGIKRKTDEKDEELFIKCMLEDHYGYLSVICDFIAGMTDNFAKSEYSQLYLV
jgi:dGTPase